MSLADEFIDFVWNCPTPYHFGERCSGILEANGYVELREDGAWREIPSKGFVLREGRALIAFNIGGTESACVAAAHCDSPGLKVVPTGNDRKEKSVPVALYGGGSWCGWCNRDLRLAGVVFLADEGRCGPVLFDSEEAVAIIPGGKITRDKGLSVDTDLNPILGTDDANLIGYLASKLQVDTPAILNWDLWFVDAERPCLCGVKQDLINSQKIDDLAGAFCMLKSFLNSTPNGTVNVLAIFDYEEEGSLASTGARSNFLSSVLRRIFGDTYDHVIARSFCVSCDCAHAVHPGFPNTHDSVHRPHVRHGPALKKSTFASYATDLTSAFPLRLAAQKTKVELQEMFGRNDVGATGSTIGPFISSALGLAVADIGSVQLSMHSIRETMAVEDLSNLVTLMTDVYSNYEEYRKIMA
jgi:aspartyl aminopeptidase